MLTPKDLGLPGKFKKWRAGQIETIEAIASSDAKVYLLDAPTGIGKSIVGIGVHQRLGMKDNTMRVLDRMAGREDNRQKRTCVYVTRTKQLQKQILGEFPKARTIEGRNNFPCLRQKDLFPDVTAEDCTHDPEDRPCEYRPECPYFIAKLAALAAPIAVLNTAYFLAEANGPGWFSALRKTYNVTYTDMLVQATDMSMLIVDEFDQLEMELMNHIEFKVTEKYLKILGLAPPRDPSTIGSWLTWSETVGIQERLASLQKSLFDISMDDWSDVEIKQNKQARRLQNFELKLKTFVRDVNDSWVFSERITDEGREWVFKPVQVAPYAEQYIWRHAKRVLGMSGTILDPKIMAESLWFGDNWDYTSMPCPFPLENRPVYYTPIANLTRKTMETELPKLFETVKKIVQQRPFEKILIHATTYAIRDYLFWAFADLVDIKWRIITHNPTNRTEILDYFKISSDPLVMISPSFDRGVDLPDDLCRCIIICLDNDTKAFTPQGLRSWDELSPGDPVFTLSDNSEIQVQPIQFIHSFPYSGRMVCLKNGTSMKMTPSHRVLLEGKGKYRYKFAKDLRAGTYGIPVTGSWKGKLKEFLDLWDFIDENEVLVFKPNKRYFRTYRKYPFFVYEPNSRTRRCYKRDISPILREELAQLGTLSYIGLPQGVVRALSYPLNDFLELVGWYIAEGYINKVGTQSFICQRPSNIQKVTTLCDKLGLRYALPCKRKILIAGRLFAGVFSFYGGRKAHFKRIHPKLLELAQENLNHLFEGLMQGDGSKRKNAWQYFTVSEELSVSFSELCLKLGYRPVIHKKEKIYNITIQRSKKYYPKHIYCESFTGTVWCLTTKADNFLAYRDGNFFFTGNCKVPYIDMGDPQVKKRMELPGGQMWYLLKAAQTIIQMSGRGVRSETDHCETYILDGQFTRLLNHTRHLMPKWWLDAIRR